MSLEIVTGSVALALIRQLVNRTYQFLLELNSLAETDHSLGQRKKFTRQQQVNKSVVSGKRIMATNCISSITLRLCYFTTRVHHGVVIPTLQEITVMKQHMFREFIALVSLESRRNN
jgi:hypothetical protein